MLAARCRPGDSRNTTSTARPSQHDVDSATFAARRRQRDLRITTSTPRPSYHDLDSATFVARCRHRDVGSTISTRRFSQHAVDTATLAARPRHRGLRSTVSTPRGSTLSPSRAFARRCRGAPTPAAGPERVSNAGRVTHHARERAMQARPEFVFERRPAPGGGAPVLATSGSANNPIKCTS